MESMPESCHSQFTIKELTTIQAGLIVAKNCLCYDEQSLLFNNIKSALAKVTDLLQQA